MERKNLLLASAISAPILACILCTVDTLLPNVGIIDTTHGTFDCISTEVDLSYLDQIKFKMMASGCLYQGRLQDYNINITAEFGYFDQDIYFWIVRTLHMDKSKIEFYNPVQ